MRTGPDRSLGSSTLRGLRRHKVASYLYPVMEAHLVTFSLQSVGCQRTGQQTLKDVRSAQTRVEAVAAWDTKGWYNHMKGKVR